MDKKNYNHITLEQRIKIEALLRAGHKASFIAKQLSIHRSSIYRELKRNQTKTGKYNAAFAQELSEEQKERYKIQLLNAIFNSTNKLTNGVFIPNIHPNER